MTDRTQIRQRVWENLRLVAKPDSRFHFNFNEYIPDFAGSDQACERLVAMDLYRRTQTLFVTPDNCLEAVRAQAVRDGKVQIVSTYGIRRGLVLLRPEDVPVALAPYATLLDAMESFGRPISLAEIREGHRLELMITGASAVSLSGARFGKGHGYFDLEYAMFREVGAVDAGTPVVAFVHDCQVVEDALQPTPFDTLVDHIVTPTRVIAVDNSNYAKPSGIFWDKVSPQMLEETPPLRELQQMRGLGSRPQGGKMMTG